MKRLLLICLLALLAVPVAALASTPYDPSMTGTITVTNQSATSITIFYQQTGGPLVSALVEQQCTGHASSGAVYGLQSTSSYITGSGYQTITIGPVWVGKAHEYVTPDYCQAEAQVPGPSRTTNILAFIQTL